jgi:hypothetical protein
VWAIAVAVVTIACAIVVALIVRARRARAEADDRAAAPEPIEEEISGLVAELAEQAVPIKKDTVIASRYRVVGKLGADDFGTAFEVARLEDGERFALRTLRRRGADRMTRFTNDAKVIAELEHPNLVPVLELGYAGNDVYLVMPLVHGGSLEQIRGRFGDAEWAMPLLAQIASGLAAMHAKGIVHRALQPSAVLLSKGTVRVADIGLAVLARKASDTTDSTSDVFAFGLLARAMLRGTPEPAWVARCLDEAPAKRPTAAELADLLAAAAR